MNTPFLSHRRDRQQTRRILADLRIRWRDLPASSFRSELDLVDRGDRLVTPHPSVFTMRGRQ
jgi:hypothetical protein